MTVTCPRCGITSPRFLKAAVAHPPGLANRMLKRATESWLARTCDGHRREQRENRRRRTEQAHWSRPGHWVIMSGVVIGSGRWVVRVDCPGGDCCDGTKLWLRAIETADGKHFFTPIAKEAMRFPTKKKAREARDVCAAWFAAWKEQVGYWPRASEPMRIFRRRTAS